MRSCQPKERNDPIILVRGGIVIYCVTSVKFYLPSYLTLVLQPTAQWPADPPIPFLLLRTYLIYLESILEQNNIFPPTPPHQDGFSQVYHAILFR